VKSHPVIRKLALSWLAAAAALTLAPAPARAQIWNRLQKHMGEAKEVKQAMAPLTIAQEIDVGREVAAKLIGFYHLYRNDALTRYVNMVGQTVAAQSDRHDITYHFAVLDSDDINAFSAPGGYIFITRGALALCDDESELAGVLAHEVGHVAAKHVLHVVERDRALSKGMEEASAYTPGSEYLKNMSNTILVKIIDQGLAPADEYDADRRGVTYAYKAGYPADGLERFLTRLNQATNQGAHSFWTRTHPPVPDRNARIQQWIASEHWNDAGRPRLTERYEQMVAVIKSKPQS
jgi:predicted Zn-dependent protease